MTAYLDFSADCILKPIWKRGSNVHVMLMVFSKIKEVFILGDKINISLGEIVSDLLKIFVLLIAWLHEFPIRNSEQQQKIKKPGLKLALVKIRNS